ncbi:MAG: ankyrin repeat domain-containing protein [Candidatus Dependentiae bacterium]|nr:ankyrin repeat domain-containing protein [Candidatus Dependentiae bacterium]
MKIVQKCILVIIVVAGYVPEAEACLCMAKKKKVAPEEWSGNVAKLVQKEVASPHRAQLLLRDIVLSGGIDTVNEQGYTRAIIAATFGDDELITMLLNRGACIDAETFDGSTALIEASEHGHSIIVKKLLDRGADINKKDIYGHTALTKAALSGHTEIVQWLIMAGADDTVRLLSSKQISKAMRQGVIVAREVQKSIESQDWLPKRLVRYGLLNACKFPAVIAKIVEGFCMPYMQSVECKDLGVPVLVERDLQRAQAVKSAQKIDIDFKLMEGIGAVITREQGAQIL